MNDTEYDLRRRLEHEIGERIRFQQKAEAFEAAFRKEVLAVIREEIAKAIAAKEGKPSV